jgi:peptide/histidine transporter 3/4
MGLDNIGFVANMVSMVLYFSFIMHFDLSGSATTTTNFLGTTFLLTLVGGFISDTYMTHLNTCVLFGGIQLLVKFTSLSRNKHPILAQPLKSMKYALGCYTFRDICCL